MKRIITILFVILLSTSLSFAQTHIPAGNVSGTWNFAGSPYIIDGEIQIQIGDTLIIELGVEVLFSGHFKFNVYGRLLAEGNADSIITFTAQDTLTGWHGLRFFNTNANGQDSSQLSYCIFEYSKATGTASSGGAIYLENSDENFEDVTICKNEALGYGGGIYMINSNPNLTGVSIYNNTATYDGGGIFCYSSIPSLIRITLNHNSTEWHGGGIACFDNSDLNLVNVTISKNISSYGGCAIACLYNSDVTLLNSIIWDNGINEICTVDNGSISATYSDIKDGTGQSYFGEGCIDADPLFENPVIGDFHLTAYSPCIDAGDPDPIYNDPDGTRNDMGAYYYQQAGLLGTVTFAPGVIGNVEEVEISITGDTTLSVYPNMNGIYYASVQAGIYTVKAILEGYYANPIQYDDVVVNPGELISGLDFEMDEIHPGNVKGIVSLNGNGLNPNIVNVEISTDGIAPVYPYPVYLQTIIIYYEYDYELAPGIYDITAHLAGYHDSTHVGVVVQPMQTISGYDFDLQPVTYEGYISGTVTLKNGPSNVEDVEVSVPGFDPVRPDANGVYTLTVVNGTYDVTAFLEGYTQVTIPDVIVLPDQTTIGIDMTLLNWDVIDGTQFVMIEYATVTYDGKFVSQTESNQLGAFGPGGESDCRGIATWQEGNHPLWSNYWDLDGYWYLTIVSNDNASGEEITFNLYETQTDSIYNCAESIIFYDDPDTCDVGAIDLNVLQSQSPPREQGFSLNQYWNWISFNLHPYITLIDTVFNSIVDPIWNNYSANQIQVKTLDNFGIVTSATYMYVINEWKWVGSFTNTWDGIGILLDIFEQYYLYNPIDTFQLSGTATNPIINPINLLTGWNWVGYFPYVHLTLSEALESIDALIVKTQDKSAVYYGGSWIGDLTQMEPGIAYKIYVADVDQLIYPLIESTKYTPQFKNGNDYNPACWKVIPGTQYNMIVMADITINNKTINNSDNYIVGVFDKEGNCHSVGKKVNDFWYFTIVGNVEGTELYFKVYNSLAEEIFESNEKITFQNDSVIGSPEKLIIITFNGSNNDIPNEYNLYNSHPNPFKQTTIISYQVPEETFVEIAIYNILGQRVKTLVNSNKDAGNHSEIWNGEDENNNLLPSGIYFYKITTDKYSKIKKLIRLK
ncbi:MAG: T9SS type A sorting domain-containing protein [Candidatus Cloacimonetes bacterium]|nr:T9SS type A sorting domain-containing protein [Candidatus Cloacimonadota bacterium]